ncbi:hypothetical protein LCGC14_1457290 [marine sediment metagenome]|uniref:Uncharacterized protein n=1 Tax=marine sediment metagenome TaxID=412755 RepID=A0A0F9LWT9_9ZZZZ
MIQFKVLSDEEILKVAEPYVDYDYRVLDLDKAIALEAQKDTLRQVVEMLDRIEQRIDIPDEVFQSAEAKRCGFTKRSFLEAGWVKIKTIKALLEVKQ